MASGDGKGKSSELRREIEEERVLLAAALDRLDEAAVGARAGARLPAVTLAAGLVVGVATGWLFGRRRA